MNRREFILYSLSFIGFSSLMNKKLEDGEVYLTQIQEELLGICRPYLIITKDYALRPEAAESFEKMKLDAEKEGINMALASSYRGYEHQKKIWNKKFLNFIKKEKLTEEQAFNKCIEFSAIPGTSRHHWGTDIDIIDISGDPIEDPLLSKEYLEGGKFEKMYKWLQENALSYGFEEIYTNVASRTGFKFEPWHYSFRPLSDSYAKEYLNIPLHNYLNDKELLGNQFLTKEFLNWYIESYLKI